MRSIFDVAGEKRCATCKSQATESSAAVSCDYDASRCILVMYDLLFDTLSAINFPREQIEGTAC